MKYAYVPKTSKFAQPYAGKIEYKSDAIIALEKKKRQEIYNLVEEINRRAEENYHLK